MARTQIKTPGIADDAVTAAKIAAGAVGTTEIADDAVTAAKIATGAVGTTEIADDAVTAAKIAAGAVGTTQLSTTGVKTGTYGSSTAIPSIAVDTKGRVTSASNAFSFTGSNQDVVGTEGYQKLPGGLIMQWGNFINSEPGAPGTRTISFPIAFPNAILNIQVSTKQQGDGGGLDTVTAISDGPSRTGVTFSTRFDATTTIYWFAIGR